MYKYICDEIKKLFPNQETIPLHEPRFWGNDKAYVNDAIDSTFVSSVGKYVNRFEDTIRDYTGAGYAVATVNGTAALHISLLLAGVKEGDLVLTQPLSFIATANAISYIKAEPLFIDIDKNTLGLSADCLESFLKEETILKKDGCYHKATGRRISACVPMHTFGHPFEVTRISELCNSNLLPLIEDAAESIGSRYKEKHTGTTGLLGAFSFNGNKTITCGGGGVIVTNNDALARLAKHMTTQAKMPHKWEFNHDMIGYNYRMPNLNAALACAQMEQLDGFIENKRLLAGIYKEIFRSTEFEFISEPAGAFSNYWLNAILLKNRNERDAFLQYSNDNGIQTRPAWTLMTNLPLFRHCINYASANAQEIEDRLVNLPSSVRPL